jgi:hypothetical protein
MDGGRDGRYYTEGRAPTEPGEAMGGRDGRYYTEGRWRFDAGEGFD